MRRLVEISLLAALYFLAARLGLKLALVNPSSTAVWPPTGIALAALLVLGYRVWPGIAIGAFLVNAVTAGSLLTSAGIAAGNTLEGVIGAVLVNRFAGGRSCFNRSQDIFRFTLFAAFATMISATIGVTSLALGGFARWSEFGTIWLTWWLGDVVGAVVVCPFLVLWSQGPRAQWTWPRLAEFTAVVGGLLIVGEIAFLGLLSPEVGRASFQFLCIPFLVWAAFRLGLRETATVSLLVCAISIWGTLHGAHGFPAYARNATMNILQLESATLVVTALVLAAAVGERRREAERFALAIESAPHAMVISDREGRIVLANSSAVEMFGYPRPELLGETVERLVPARYRREHPGHRAVFLAHPEPRLMGVGRDLYAVRKDGSEFAVEVGLSTVETDGGPLVLTTIIDISERKRAEEEIRRLASTDSLTGLANHRKLIDVLAAEIQRSDRTARPFAVLLLDLDGLKRINDQHGHLVGSRALCRMAQVLLHCCRAADTAARYGGDEFAVVVTEADERSVPGVVRRIRDQAAGDTEEPRISVTVGAAMYPGDGKTIEQLLGAADLALYEMKRNPGRASSGDQAPTPPEG